MKLFCFYFPKLPFIYLAKITIINWTNNHKNCRLKCINFRREYNSKYLCFMTKAQPPKLREQRQPPQIFYQSNHGLLNDYGLIYCKRKSWHFLVNIAYIKANRAYLILQKNKMIHWIKLQNLKRIRKTINIIKANQFYLGLFF